MSDPVFRIACLGAGYFSSFQIEAWERISQAKLVAIADQDPEKANNHPLCIYDDLSSMLEESKADILDIITPPSTHLNAIRTAIDFELKAIICQKPFCTSLQEANEAVVLAQKAGIELIIHENFRFQPWYRVIAKAIQDGRIGRVHQLIFRMRTGDGQGDEAYLARQPYFQKMERFLIHETGVHYIDTFRYLLGDIRSVYADLRKMNPIIAGEDAGHVIFTFDNAVRAIYDADRNLDHLTDNPRRTFGEALVEGTKGSIILEGDGSVKFRSFASKAHEILLAPQEWKGFAGDCVYALQKHVIEALLGKEELENSASDYLTVIEIEEAIYRSAAEGKRLDIN